MAIEITFRKQVQVDLNKYYDSFSPKLRAAINDELFKIIGGQPVRAKRVESTGATMFTLTGEMPIPNSRSAAVIRDLQSTTVDGEKIDGNVIRDFAVQRGLKARSILANLVRCGYLKIAG